MVLRSWSLSARPMAETARSVTSAREEQYPRRISEAPLTSSRYPPLFRSLITAPMHFLPESKGNICTTCSLARAAGSDCMPRWSLASCRRAVSVLDPMKANWPWSSPSKAVELTATDWTMASLAAGDRPDAHWETVAADLSSVLAKLVDPNVPATTVILLVVRVPVLSEHTVVALPIVSQARRTRTRLFSLSMRVVAKARASVTASGRPSGTATTMMVMATIRMSYFDRSVSE